MPTIKRTGIKSREVKTGFEPYDGEEPTKRGMYRAKLKQVDYKRFKRNEQTGIQNEGFKILVELEAAAGDPKSHKKFDGYPVWTNLVFGDKENMIAREENFYAAIGVKDEPTISTENGDVEDGVKVKTIGGKKPLEVAVNVDLKPRRDGQDGMEVDGIYKLSEVAGKKAPAVVAEEDEDEDLLEEDDEDETDEEQTREEREVELKSASLAELKSLATSDYDIDIKGMKKSAIVEAILDYEFTSEALAEEEDDEEEDDDEVEEDEIDDEEEDDDDDEERAERIAELAKLDRVALRKLIKSLDPEFAVLKRHSEDDLRNAIIAEEFGADDGEETPF